MNRVAQLEFEHAYSDIAVQQASNYATRFPALKMYSYYIRILDTVWLCANNWLLSLVIVTDYERTWNRSW